MPSPPRGTAWRPAYPAGFGSLSKLHRAGGDRARLARLRRLGEACALPLEAAGGALMHVPERKPLLDTLAAIRNGARVQDLGEALGQNRERRLRTREALGGRSSRSASGSARAVLPRSKSPTNDASTRACRR